MVAFALSLLMYWSRIRPRLLLKFHDLRAGLMHSQRPGSHFRDASDDGSRAPLRFHLTVRDASLSPEHVACFVANRVTSAVLAEIQRDPGRETKRWLFKFRDAWFECLPGGIVQTRRIMYLNPQEICGSWVSLVKADGTRVFSFLLPKPLIRDDALDICERLNRDTASDAFVLEAFGAPEGARVNGLFPGWGHAIAGQVANLALVCMAYNIAAVQCGDAQCATGSGVPLSTLWILLGALFPFLSWLVVTPVSLAFGDDLYSGGPLLATRRLVMRIPGAILLGAMLATVVSMGLHPVDSSLDFSVLASLHLFLGLVLVHSAAIAANRGNRGNLSLVFAWSVYGLSLAVAPDLWLLPPLMAALLPVARIARGMVGRQAGGHTAIEHPRRGNGFQIFCVGPLLSATVTGILFWGDKVAMTHLFAEQGPAGPGGAVFIGAAIPVAVVCAWYFGRLGPSLSRLWNVTAEVMCEGSIPVFNASRMLMVPLLNLVIWELVLVLQFGWLAGIGFFMVAYPGDLQQYQAMIHASGFCAVSFVLGVWLMAMKSWHPVVSAITILAGSVAAGIWFARRHHIEITFESFNLILLVSAGIVAPLLASFARRVGSLPQYPVFWRRVASW